MSVNFWNNATRKMTVGEEEATDSDWLVVQCCWARRSELTKSERRTVDRLLKARNARPVMGNDITIEKRDMIGLARIAWRYRGHLSAESQVIIAMKGGVPAEHA